ncbi:MAG: hypothetical protein A2X12_08715 [Bacteroidetes bacterium GWE2_29_8]|nr:MAG: hypothetical protein A2X12_08715 [Bacteroidetes bacterium GWE2_29_8]OFY18363.1 MAG: hypothetical protein A2X02_08475 [Bacteroidetes bacterium GWF2_29_10]
MSTNLIINKTHTESESVNIIIEGRLDSLCAEQLASSVEEDIRAGYYNVAIDMAAIEYISSAGIRVLVKIYKQLHSVNGKLTLSSISENVKTVLDLAGLIDMFLHKETNEVKHEAKPKNKEITISNILFNIFEENESEMKCSVYGNPDKLTSMNFSKDDSLSLEFNGNKYGIGMGCIATNYDDCNNNFGEFIAVHDFVAYLPPNSKHKPDFILKTGNLIPVINMLYGITCQGTFSKSIHFDSGKQSATLSSILQSISQISNYETYFYVMIAETDGLIGAAINTQTNNSTQNIFDYPEIKEKLYFNTEPIYEKMLTLVTGIVTKNKQGQLNKFVRPLNSTSSDLLAHSHAAIFDYMPLKKRTTSLSEMLKDLLENKELVDILHLINDDRIINGSGESKFTKGHCWIANIKELTQ